MQFMYDNPWAITPSGDMLAICVEDHCIDLYDLSCVRRGTTNAPHERIPAARNPSAMAFMVYQHRLYLISGGDDGSVAFLEVKGFRRRRLGFGVLVSASVK